MEDLIPSKIEKLQDLLDVRDKQIDALLEITRAINANLPAENLYQTYQLIVCEQLGLSEIALFVFDQTWKRPIWQKENDHDFFIPVQDILNQEQNCRKLTIEEAQKADGFQYIIPIFHKDNAIALALFGSVRIDLLDEIDELLEFAQIITNLVTVAVENKRLFKKEVEKKQFDKELELASKVQGMLIPKKLPKNNMYEFSGLYLPYKGIGGDYYDVIHINKDEFIFCIGDISGKGIAAALIMANLQAYLNVSSTMQQFDAIFFNQLNSKVYSITEGEMFITLFVGKYNILTKELIYVNAGHNPPILINENHIQLLENGTTMLGVFEELPKLNFGNITIEQNSLIVCYTDGLTELESDKNEEFSAERLIQFSLKNQNTSTDIFNKILYKEISEFKRNVLFSDDISLLCGKFY